MLVQGLKTEKIASLPQWEQMVKPFNFTEEQTNQFVTNMVRFISDRAARAFQKHLEKLKEIRRRDESRNK